jgi:hypothetical protein
VIGTKASDRGFLPKGGHMEIAVLISALASAVAFITRIVKLNLEEEF